jgi:DNA primase
MEAAGLVRRTRRGGLVDVFRDRAVIPVRDAAGRLAGFTGRARDGIGAGVPRYLNSPRTVLYDKGAILFGLWESRAALAAGSVPVLTEGPLDAVAVSASCSGRMVGLAPCGTALTASQARALGQVARLEEAGVRMAFDGDAAGLRGAVRAYRLLASMAPRLSAVVLPSGQDPAGILSRDGPAALAGALETRSRPLADLVVDAELSQWGRWLGYETGRVSALHAVAAVVAGLRPDEIARQVARVAERLALGYDIVTLAVADALSSAVGSHLNRPAAGQEQDPAVITERNRIR